MITMLNKRVIFLFVFITIFSSSCASAIGISPAIVRINFEEGKSFSNSYSFNIDPEDDSNIVEISLEGDLAQYATLSEDMLEGSGIVVVNVNLPQYIEEPGPHAIYVSGKELSPQSEEGAFGISLVANIRSIIRVDVPYPGKYGELGKFVVQDANENEQVPFSLEVYSRGEEEIVTPVSIEVYNSDDVLVERVDLGNKKIPGIEKLEINERLTGLYKSGTYKAVAKMGSVGDGTSIREDEFRVGELSVRIYNNTQSIIKGEVNKIEMEVESQWNGKIEEVYGEFIIEGIDDSILTPTFEFGPWQRRKLNAFFDSSELSSDLENVRAKMKVHYDGESTEKGVILIVIKTGSNVPLIISILIGVIGLVLLLIWYIRRIREKVRYSNETN